MSNYEGLPSEFGTPLMAAQHLADLETRVERLAYFERIPRQWQKLIADQARLVIAGEIIKMPTRIERNMALAEVPHEWREEVTGHVKRLWRQPAVA